MTSVVEAYRQVVVVREFVPEFEDDRAVVQDVAGDDPVGVDFPDLLNAFSCSHKDFHDLVSVHVASPRVFQRFEAWDRQRICSLMETVIHNLPLGIMLVLEVGDSEKFISRYLKTAPEKNGRIYEHLLDGQQRLTALWRAFHNNCENETYLSRGVEGARG